MALDFRSEHVLERPVRLLPGIALGGAHAEVDHGIRREVLPIRAAAHLPDVRALKQGGIGYTSGDGLEERLHHGHADRLAKSARTAEKRRLVVRVEHVCDEGGLIDEHRPRGGGGEPVVADGQAPAPRAIHDAGVRDAPYAITAFMQLNGHMDSPFSRSLHGTAPQGA